MGFIDLWKKGKNYDEKEAIWMDGFSSGMNKAWDLMLPTMLDNIDKMKSKIREDATLEAINRLNGGKRASVSK